MWHKSIAALALCQLLPAAINAAPTWPDVSDEMEDLMVLNTGYRSRGFADIVTPCSNSPVQGFRVAAGFLRTAFHDAAAYDSGSKSHGLDASIAFELEGDFATHNTGPGFNATIAWLSGFYNSKASVADLLALGVYSTVRSCGGPQIAIRTGRKDATGPGPDNLPDSGETYEKLNSRFATQGWSAVEMAQLTACGHTLGGVHIPANPSIVAGSDPQKAAQQNVLVFDDSDAKFDNDVVVDYLKDGVNGFRDPNPLVNGNPNLASDKRINDPVKDTLRNTMSSADGYKGVCQNLLARMLNNVPGGAGSLNPAISVYDVKPGVINLNVIKGGSALAFSSEVRLRTKSIGQNVIGPISTVVIQYTTRKGETKSINAKKGGTAAGFDDQFEFWGWSAEVESVTSFTVVVNGKPYNNNGNGFPVNDQAFVQLSSSSLSGNKLTVVVAARSSLLQLSAPQFSLSTISDGSYNKKLPTVSKSSFSGSKICGDSLWTYYTATTTVSGSTDTAKLDFSIAGTTIDSFRDIYGFQSSGTAPVCGAASSTTTSQSSTSSSSSITSSVSSSTSVSSSLTSTSSTSVSSSSSSKTTSGSSSSTSTSTGTGKTSGSSSSTSTSTGTGKTSGSSSSTSTSTGTGKTSGSSSTTATSSGKTSSLTTSASSSSSSSSTLSTTTSGGKIVDPITSSTTSGKDGAVSTTTGKDGTSSTKSGDKPDSTSDTSSYDAPNWTKWNPEAPKPTRPSYTDGSSEGSGEWSGYGKKPHAGPGDLVSSIYRDHASVPAPHGGIQSDRSYVIVKTTIVYVDPGYSAPTYINGGGDYKPSAGALETWRTWTAPAPTGAPAQSSQWQSADVAAPGSQWQSADVAAPGSQWQPADVVKPTGTGKGGPSATKTGLVGKYTGAANSLARSEAVMMGAAAMAGVVALVL